MQDRSIEEVVRILNQYTESDELYDLPYDYEECDFRDVDDSLRETDPRILLVAGVAYIIGEFEKGKPYEENPNVADAHVHALQIPSSNEFVFDANLPWLKKRIELFEKFCYENKIALKEETPND